MIYSSENIDSSNVYSCENGFSVNKNIFSIKPGEISIESDKTEKRAAYQRRKYKRVENLQKIGIPLGLAATGAAIGHNSSINRYNKFTGVKEIIDYAKKRKIDEVSALKELEKEAKSRALKRGVIGAATGALIGYGMYKGSKAFINHNRKKK